MKELKDRLTTLRRWLVLEGFMRCLVRYGVVVFGILLVLASLNALTGREILNWPMGLCLAGLAVFYPLIHALAHRPSLEEAAVEYDQRAGTGDRLITTWELSKTATPSSGGLLMAALHEGIERLKQQDFRGLLHWPARRQWLALVVVALATPAVLQVPALWQGAAPGQDPEALAQQSANQKIARQLREAAQAFSPLADTRQDSRAIDALEDAARRLETAAPARAEELRKQALTELSAVEAAVRGALGASQQMNLSPSEMSQLAAALQGIRQFEKSGRDLAAGRPDDAGRELSETLTRLQEDGQDPRQSVRQVSRALAQSSIDPNGQSAEGADSELMQQLMSEDAAQAAEALRQIARQLQTQGQRRPAGSRQTPNQGGAASQRLSKLLKDLAEMKDQARGEQLMIATSDMEKNPEGADSESMALVNSQGSQADDSQMLLMPNANGSFTIGPQDQQDFGTGEPLAEDQTMEITENREGDPLRAAPLLDDSGETLQSLTLSNGDFSRGSAEYRRLYEQAQPFVEDAIEREEVPLGSRELVKRYFESIRPQ